MSNNEKYVCVNCVEPISKKDTDIKRLRKLLRQCQPFVDRLQPPTLDLSVEIAKELGDE